MGRGSLGADRIVTDYMSALNEHLIYTLRQKLGDAVARNMPLEFVVTMTAIRSELVNDRTRIACKMVFGLSESHCPGHLVSEPEAAAIYALHGLDHHGLQVDDIKVVVEAGGGTVDLI